MKRLLTCIAGLAALTTTSCVFSSFITSTPKDVIRQNVACPTDNNARAESFKVISTHRWSQGVIVLYSALCPGNGTRPAMKQVFGHKVVKRYGMSWQVSGSDSYGTENQSQYSEQLIEYDISKSPNQKDSYTILYGQALKPKVTAVEATFDNGKILRDESSNGVFALISPGASRVCELRIFGDGNQILQQEDPVVPKNYSERKQMSSNCLPTSHTL